MDLKLNDDNDLAIVNNDLVLISGADEVTQNLRSRLRTYEGEWFLDTTIGLPYYREIFVKRQKPERIAAYFKREILKTPGVLALLQFEQDQVAATRQLNISFTAQAIDGEILPVNEVVG